MTPEGEEDQIDRFVKNKTNPNRFEEEMIANGVNEECRATMHRVLDRFQGCAATQESFMTLSQELVGFTLKEADALRKTVAKKKMNEITKQKDLFFSKGQEKGYTNETIEYFWRVVIAPSLGYGFSENHALPYSIVGCQCILLGGILFPKIFWQLSCLLQRSGILADKNADYNKIAKAVAMIAKENVEIRPLNINKSEKIFSIDLEKNIIHYGFVGVKGLKEKVIDKILELRPFDSIYDFMVRTSADIGSIVTLIKAGAFDEFGSRQYHIDCLARFKSEQKEKLNGQNLAMIAKRGMWPQGEKQYDEALRIFNFTIYLKHLEKKVIKEEHLDFDPKEFFYLNDRAADFLDEIGFEYQADGLLSKPAWKAYYDLAMRPIKQYLQDNQEALLEKVNNDIIAEWKEKYFPTDKGTAQNEIETMGLCFAEHPLKNMTQFADFNALPQQPEVVTIKNFKNKHIPIYKLDLIAGYVIAKDKLHSSITLLTATGPVDVKFRKEQFANYDAQISSIVDGKKKIIERSWFSRGTGLIICGMRQDDQFVAKTYKSSKLKHSAYKIDEILPDGKVSAQKERKKGTAEEAVEVD